MSNNPDKLIAEFLKEFANFKLSFKSLTENKRLRFSSAARGCVNKAQDCLLEAQELIELSNEDNDFNKRDSRPKTNN